MALIICIKITQKPIKSAHIFIYAIRSKITHRSPINVIHTKFWKFEMLLHTQNDHFPVITVYEDYYTKFKVCICFCFFLSVPIRLAFKLLSKRRRLAESDSMFVVVFLIEISVFTLSCKAKQFHTKCAFVWLEHVLIDDTKMWLQIFKWNHARVACKEVIKSVNGNLMQKRIWNIVGKIFLMKSNENNKLLVPLLFLISSEKSQWINVNTILTHVWQA